jgi:hypothetical protein
MEDKTKKQRYEYVLNEKGLVELVPVEGEPTGIVDSFLNDLVTLVRPFSLKEKRALILLAKEMNEDLIAKEQAAKKAKKETN